MRHNKTLITHNEKLEQHVIFNVTENQRYVIFLFKNNSKKRHSLTVSFLN